MCVYVRNITEVSSTSGGGKKLTSDCYKMGSANTRNCGTSSDWSLLGLAVVSVDTGHTLCSHGEYGDK